MSMLWFDELWDQYLIAGVCWLLLIFALGQAARANPAPLRQRLPVWFGALLVVAIAWRARQSAPFWPLHSNTHAYSDITTALGLPWPNGSGSPYGVAWTGAQQLTVPLFGAHHDGLASWSAVAGAVAAGFAFLVAWRAGRHLPAALLAGLLAALAPVAVRVGHSESAFVVAQVLVGAALYLALGPRTVTAATGIAASIALLALGHPLGLFLGFGVALLAWAIAPDPWTSRGAALAHLALLGWVAALAGGLSVSLSGDLLADRLGGAGSARALEMLSNYASRLLWTNPDWSPSGAAVLVLLGVAGFLRTARGALAGRALAVAGGCVALGAFGVVNFVCVADALRYQSVWVAPVALFVGLAPAAVSGLGVRWSRLAAVGVLLAGAVTAVQLLQPMQGDRVLDIQGQEYRALRRRFANERGIVTLVRPAGVPGGPCFDLPLGPWSARGPTIAELRVEQLEHLCQAGLPLPAPLAVVSSQVCEAEVPAGGSPPCAALRQYQGPEVWSARTAAFPVAPDALMAPDFQPFTTPVPQVRIASARCR